MKNTILKWMATASLALAPAVMTAQNDEEVVVPEGLEVNYEDLLADWTAKNYINIDSSDCQTLSSDPFFEREEYVRRLSRLPNIIEMPYNDVVRQFIDRYTVKMRGSMPIVLAAANFYTPIFEEALEANGLPLELKYLPMVESCYKPTATSHAGAAGLWQFMITTAKRYDLTVNSLIDERMDVVKASYAAARYLKDLYGIFGDWTLAIAAYNCGPENVSKAMRRSGGEERDYWKLMPYLPAETRGYVPAFIAANYVMNYYCQHGICPATATLPTATDTVVVNRTLHFDQVAAVCNVSMEEIKALNPQYRGGIIPGESQPCALRLQPTAIAAFIDAGDSIYNHRSEELLPRREIEVEEVETVAAAPKKQRATGGGAKYVTVGKGDTLSSIARRNGTTIDALRRLNGVRGSNIKKGQRLKVK